jgi:hypothetical protein
MSELRSFRVMLGTPDSPALRYKPVHGGRQDHDVGVIPDEDHCSGELRWVYNGRDESEPVLQQLWTVWDHDKKTITPEWRRVPEFEEAIGQTPLTPSVPASPT